MLNGAEAELQRKLLLINITVKIIGRKSLSIRTSGPNDMYEVLNLSTERNLANRHGKPNEFKSQG